MGWLLGLSTAKEKKKYEHPIPHGTVPVATVPMAIVSGSFCCKQD
jgi:hypothetical protein